MAKSVKYSLFLDESCHLQKDKSNVMSIGFIKVLDEGYDQIKNELKQLKMKHGIPHEYKWNTCSNTKKDFYIELIDYFFTSSLSFRTIVVKYKNHLDHDQFNQGSHDNFYYKMVFYLLHNQYINPLKAEYRVYLDIKDTRGREKIAKIREVFENLHFGRSPFKHFQHIRSHESELIQLADFLIGAVTYKSRGQQNKPGASPIKCFIVEYLEQKSGYSLDEGTEPWEEKFNIFDHQPKKKS
ncbi:MAG: DUF3800 domain-containing protein [Marinilabiliales bacterium]|nr:DUF3800 domain-containing protein [Marinilabiliales bacterium]